MKKTLLCLGIVTALAGCARDANTPVEVWKNFDQSAVLTTNVEKDRALVVLYRQNDIQGPAVNVYINGDYQASLLPNAYTTANVCSHQNLFTSSFTTVEKFGNRIQGVNYTLPQNQTTYIKVTQDSAGKLNFVQVDSAVAEKEIAGLPKENQTLSRVVPKCDGNRVLAKANLDAGALFAFNKSGYQNILTKGKQEIEAFAKNIPTLTGATKIVVSGHTDPAGSEQYNQKLSEQRAETVKFALQRSGVTLPIEAVGYGESKLIVTHCDSLTGKAKQQCNQPNRRVEIEVFGN